MNPARSLRHARRAAGLTQRELAERAGIPQPTIARIERGRNSPGLRTLVRLLRACGRALEVQPVLGVGVDRTAIRELLRLTPAERLHLCREEANNLQQLTSSALLLPAKRNHHGPSRSRQA